MFFPKIVPLAQEVNAASSLIAQCLLVIPPPFIDAAPSEAVTWAQQLQGSYREVDNLERTNTAGSLLAVTEAEDASPLRFTSTALELDVPEPEACVVAVENLTLLLGRDVVPNLSFVKTALASMVSALKNAHIAQLKAIDAADTVHEENQTLMTEIGQLTAEVKGLRAKITTLEGVQTEFTHAGPSQANVTSLQQRIQELEKQLNVTQGRAQRRGRRHDTLYEDLATRHAQERVDELEEEVEACRSTVESFRRMNLYLRRALNPKIPKGFRASLCAQNHSRRYTFDHCRAKPCVLLAPKRRTTGPYKGLRNVETPVHSETNAVLLGHTQENPLLKHLESKEKDKMFQEAKSQVTLLETEKKTLTNSLETLTQKLESLKTVASEVDRLEADVKAKGTLITRLRNTVTQQEQLLRSQRALLERYRCQAPSSVDDDDDATGSRSSETMDIPGDSLHIGSSSKKTEKKSQEVEALIQRRVAQIEEEYKRKIAKLASSHQREVNALARAHEEAFAETRDKYLRRLMRSQQQITKIAASSKNGAAASHNAAPPLPIELNPAPCQSPPPNNAKITDHEESLPQDNLNDSQTFVVRLPEATASIRVPLKPHCRAQDAVVLHVTFPAQQLSICSKTRTVKAIPEQTAATCDIVSTTVDLSLNSSLPRWEIGSGTHLALSATR